MRRYFPILAALTLLPAIASAHAFLAGSVPAVGSSGPAPPVIRLRFSEEIEPAFSAARLAGPHGAVLLASSRFDPQKPEMLILRPKSPLRPGRYTVQWEVVSVDTHRTRGSFGFTVTGGR